MDHALPKYFVIKKDILSKINEEIYKPDETIPPERELMEIYNVSRITVRKAIDELVSECHLYKVQGKGTYVKGHSRTTGLSVVTSCTSEIRQQGFVPTRKVIYNEIEPCSKKVARELEINDGERVLHIKRIYFADEEPVIYCENYIVVSYFPDLDRNDLNVSSLYQLIEEKYNIPIIDSVRYIEAVAAFEDIAECLDISEGYPTLRFTGTTRGMINNKVTPFEYFDSNYITGKIRFRIDQKTVK